MRARRAMLGGLCFVAAFVPAASANAAIHAFRDQQTNEIVVQGTDGDDEIWVGGDVDSDVIQIDSYQPITTGWGCYNWNSTLVYCSRGPFPPSLYVDGGAGDDVIRRDYNFVGGPEYDPALIDGGAGDDQIGGSAGEDIIVGGSGDDLVDGQRGDDLVIGGPLKPTGGESAGTDHVYGGWGDDVVIDGDDESAGIDADRLDGGSCDPDIEGYGGLCRDEGPRAADFDLVDWSGRLEAVKVDLDEGGATQGTLGPGGMVIENETLANIDGALTGDGDDMLTGGVGDDLFAAGAGADTIDGNGGDDLLDGEQDQGDVVVGGTGADVLSGGAELDAGLNALSDGADSVDGGPGEDEVTYAGRAEAVTVALAVAGAPQGAGGEGDTVVNVESAEGGDAADRLTGNSQRNTLTGNGGDDAIDTSGDTGSADAIACGAGADSLRRDSDDTYTACETVETPASPPPGNTSTQPSGPAPGSSPKPHPAMARPAIGGRPSATVRATAAGLLKLRDHTIACAGLGPTCRVSLVLRRRGTAGKLAHRTVTVPAAGKWTPTVRLDKAGRKLLRGKRGLKASLELTVTRGDVTVRRQLSLRLLRP